MKNITLTRNGQTAPRDVETSTMRRIADALDEIAGTLAAMWNSTKESEAKDD